MFIKVELVLQSELVKSLSVYPSGFVSVLERTLTPAK